MRTPLLVLTALVAFAANSVLCRAALDPARAAIDPASFTALRLISGAAFLGLLVILRGGGLSLRRASPVSAAALFAYAAPFSFAYVALDAGLGALILFGAVQTGMFAGALLGGERPGAARWAGAAAGMAGLAWIALPGAEAPPLLPSLLMVVAGFAWAVFSLRGRGSAAPLEDMARAFALCVPAAALLAVFGAPESATGAGIALALASGALASGAGYAVWYAVLPKLEASLAAVAQLGVPLIALGGGVAFLGEPVSPRFWIAAALILGGVGAATLVPARRRA
ncbi:MAG: DMT family transporter [Pseudomonadota bacterium]